MPELAAPRPTPARVRVGFGLIAVVALLATTVFFADAIIRARLEGPTITVLAHSAPGLAPGSAVWVAGRPAGRVLSVSLRPVEVVAADAPTHAHVLIEAVIDRVAGPVLRSDATADVRPSDLLAPVIVAVHPGTGIAPAWNFADTLRRAGPPLDPEAVLARADTLMQAVRSLEARAAEAREAVVAGSGSLRRLREDAETLDGLRRGFGTLRELADRDASRSLLSRMATDTLVGTAVGRVRERLAAWDAPADGHSPYRSLEAATTSLDALGGRLASLARRIERGEGTAGRALMDGEFRRQLDALRASADALAEELLVDPSRWLRLRVY